MPSASGGPRDVLVVGWYPGADDPIAGRFIADQAAALLATGRVRPLVASFEPFWLHGDRALRGAAASAWPGAVRAAAGAGMVPAPVGAFGPPGVPVARIGTPAGRAPGIGADNEAQHRERALLAALEGMDRQYDLVHAHVGYPEGAAAARVARRLGIPIVITEHATYLARILADPATRARYLEAGRTAARLIAVGRLLADQLRAELPELADRLVVIPNVVDVASFPMVGPADRDGDELLWVGYRREVKGMDVLLRAFAGVRAARPATTLRLVGRSTTEDEEAGWHAMAAELGVAEAVRFDPPTDRAGVAAAMARAGLFVHPSRRETFGIVAAEALASGLPVVATDSGGVTEVLGDDPDELGALVPAGDPHALAAAILRVLDRRPSFDPQVLRAFVEARYGAPVVAGRIADLYDGVVAAMPADRRRRAAEPGTGRALSASPAAPPMVLVAFDRPALDRLLPRCPPWLLAGLIVVTRGEPVTGVRATESIPAAIDSPLVELLGAGPAGGVRQLIRSPLRGVGRRWRRARLRAAVMPALSAAIEHGLGLSADGRPVILCLGGVDVAASAPVVEAGLAVFAPGGLRWLGDQRWADAAPSSSP